MWQVADGMEIGKDDSDEEKVAAMGAVVAVNEAVYVKVVEIKEDDGSGRYASAHVRTQMYVLSGFARSRHCSGGSKGTTCVDCQAHCACQAGLVCPVTGLVCKLYIEPELCLYRQWHRVQQCNDTCEGSLCKNNYPLQSTHTSEGSLFATRTAHLAMCKATHCTPGQDPFTLPGVQ